jgi:hypothetical protein
MKPFFQKRQQAEPLALNSAAGFEPAAAQSSAASH